MKDSKGPGLLDKKKAKQTLSGARTQITREISFLLSKVEKEKLS